MRCDPRPFKSAFADLIKVSIPCAQVSLFCLFLKIGDVFCGYQEVYHKKTEKAAHSTDQVISYTHALYGAIWTKKRLTYCFNNYKVAAQVINSV